MLECTIWSYVTLICNSNLQSMFENQSPWTYFLNIFIYISDGKIRFGLFIDIKSLVRLNIMPQFVHIRHFSCNIINNTIYININT